MGVVSAQLALALLFLLLVVAISATVHYIYLYRLSLDPEFVRRQREGYQRWREAMEEWWEDAYWIELEELVPRTLDYYRQGRNGDYLGYPLGPGG